MSALIENAKTVALVGNGPVSSVAAGEIDKADVVVRMNRAQLCGVAGTRTDVLAINDIVRARNFGRIGSPINPLSVRSAREYWLYKRLDTDDERVGRPIVYLFPETYKRASADLLRHAPDDTVRIIPSIGALTLRYVLDNSDADIQLFGFTHQGDHMHLWDIEGRWMRELADGERVRYCSKGGDAVRQPPLVIMQLQARRLLNHIRNGRF
ncbi:MAG: hypothetical protein CL535_15365 [Ahrensia sp.]|nr:hypothetical protein [Ahrensia sp.]|tara:strand:- start:9555 stop:10184 length:630 start_codon:yes stop_codon:yes gene_type:complete